MDPCHQSGPWLIKTAAFVYPHSLFVAAITVFAFRIQAVAPLSAPGAEGGGEPDQ